MNSIAFIAFGAFFIANYLSEKEWREEFVDVINHLDVMMSFLPEMRYTGLYLLEEINSNDI